jgi:cation diffusion facilitator CzcD-associated flavoprotein CzcO
VEHLDVLIIGAGLSGISAAWHLQTDCAGLSYAIVEGRERMGGKREGPPPEPKKD